jgi:hypothetical protein
MKKKVHKDKAARKADTQKLEAILKLLRSRERSTYRKGEVVLQQVTFEVKDNGELRYIISCLLRTCILALDSEQDFSSPKLFNCSRDHTISTLLDLADSLLPDDQLESYDAIEKLLLGEA